MSKEIQIKILGRMGNAIIQAMVAESLRMESGSEVNISLEVPLKGINLNYPVKKINVDDYEKVIVIKNVQTFDFNKIVEELKNNFSILIKLEAWVQRVEYFEKYRDWFCKNLFPKSLVNPINLDNYLLIHIRGGDILNGSGSNQYFPLPVSYYESIAVDSGLEPLFIGEINNFYGEILKRRFSSSLFIECNDPWKTWLTIRNAKHCAISISTFSWTACFLSENLEKMYFPVAGLFSYQENKNKKMRTNLIEPKNKKNIYYDFPNYYLNISQYSDLHNLLQSGPEVFKKMSTEEIELVHKKMMEI